MARCKGFLLGGFSIGPVSFLVSFPPSLPPSAAAIGTCSFPSVSPHSIAIWLVTFGIPCPTSAFGCDIRQIAFSGCLNPWIPILRMQFVRVSGTSLTSRSPGSVSSHPPNVAAIETSFSEWDFSGVDARAPFYHPVALGQIWTYSAHALPKYWVKFKPAAITMNPRGLTTALFSRRKRVTDLGLIPSHVFVQFKVALPKSSGFSDAFTIQNGECGGFEIMESSPKSQGPTVSSLANDPEADRWDTAEVGWFAYNSLATIELHYIKYDA
ncbi:hypothetical protein EDC04DRAFT_2600632 [Pisolithus marmoratus]|nr:hypothetical protein EDC04DRAFT_2600632 [Pisolithus marmoratus]